MRAAYRNSFFDLWAVNFWHQFTSWAVQFFFIGFSVWLGHLVATGSSCKAAGCSVFVGVIAGLMLYLAQWAIQILFVALYLYSKRYKTDSAEYSVELRDEALYVATEYNQSEFFWKGIYKVQRVFTYITIQVTPRVMFVVPKKAFASKSDKNSFFEAVAAHVLRAK